MRPTAMIITAAGLLLCVHLFANPVPAGTSAPPWILTGGIRQYPADLFITGTGSADVVSGDTADAQAEADAKAMAQVAKQIRVKIRQLSQSFERETATTEGLHNQYDVWQKTAAFIDIRVEGVRIADRYYDKQANRLFSLAMLDRFAQGRMLSEQIRRLRDNAAVLMQEARKHVDNVQKVHRSVVAYRLATTKLLRALRKNQYLGLIAPQMTHGRIVQDLSQLQGDLSRLSSKFEMRPVSGDRQSARIGGHLPEPVSVQVFYGQRPAPSIPIAFLLENGTGQLDPKAVTNATGMASTSVSNLGPTGHKINKITAAIAFFPTDNDSRASLRALVPPIETQFSYFLPAVGDIKIAVLIQETNMGYRQPESYLANLLKHELSRLKFRVIKQLPPGSGLGGVDVQGVLPSNPRWAELSGIADVAVLGEVHSRLAEDSYSPSLVFSHGRAIVKIVDLNANSELGTVDVSAKSAGASREASGRRVIKKTSRQAVTRITQAIRRALMGDP